MSPYFWRSHEKALVARMYEAGAPLRDIAAATGVSDDTVRRAVGRWKLRRPAGHIGIETRTNLAWPRIRLALEQHGPMSTPELCVATGMMKSVVVRNLARYRGEMHVARWIPTSRRPAAVWALGPGTDAIKPLKVRRVMRTQANPFLVALGAIAAPKNHRGRVIEMLDEPETV
ncbi:hypothetical protein WS62_23430 [Burkholderia sp. ABCPW 14]|uniref:helix-turn-helix domain-containing protein n=1 Tax=Burkholderia sp. ABCPW 14 TaxID=1637860 RepID=UPI000770C963|nr:helix-turn-helix domain-containing protein [Burkholderia sp. ABCPW 14]KVD81911.1 hypothetical protein WS62_23430 [Burkholderia sp. ABCPW 14]